MKKNRTHRTGQRGFTLLEILITVIVAGILAAMFVEFMGTSMIRSAEPLISAKEGFSLSEVMEKMTADYKFLLTTDITPLQTFKTHVENGNVVANDPYFGEYTPQTQYIDFQGGSEVVDTSGDNRTLKVTLTHGDQTLVALFTK